MSRNIKEIGKELMGKSLNSFHRKTGLTQLEENNKMQDGILDGILSQVDDAYIEKTEQSNVIHLDGSGDGVVVVDSIEGNTMVNYNLENKIVTRTSSETGIQYRDFRVIGKPNTEYTAIINVTKNTTSGSNVFNWGIYIDGATRGNNNLCNGSTQFINVQRGKTGILMCKFTSRNDLGSNPYLVIGMHNDWQSSYEMEIKDIILLEGDYTNKEVNFFEGMQSSFEEHKTDEGKYEIEILSKNRNLINISTHKDNNNNQMFSEKWHILQDTPIHLDKNKTYNFSSKFIGRNIVQAPDVPALHISIRFEVVNADGSITNRYSSSTNSIGSSASANGTTHFKRTFTGISKINAIYVLATRFNGEIELSDFQLNEGSLTTYVEPKQNKIKLLLDEPLRAIDNIKDRLCIRDNKLMVERNINQIILDNNKTYGSYNSERPAKNGIISYYYQLPKEIRPKEGTNKVICDILPYNTQSVHNRDEVGIASYMHDSQNQNHIRFCLTKNILGITEELQSKPYTTELLQFLRTNPISVVYRLNKPYYEEVLNEYGEPIILEGYENGTIYIDSTIVPTTTVRYTPKMESFKTLKEVENNNIILTNDVNDNIIPYMMDVDLMIMEKEMALPSKANIRTMEVLDMTSMQKRTQDMLERLIKGKTLTEKECKTRVVTYLNAGKITDEQADELMLLISEVYA